MIRIVTVAPVHVRDKRDSLLYNVATGTEFIAETDHLGRAFVTIHGESVMLYADEFMGSMRKDDRASLTDRFARQARQMAADIDAASAAGIRAEDECDRWMDVHGYVPDSVRDAWVVAGFIWHGTPKDLRSTIYAAYSGIEDV